MDDVHLRYTLERLCKTFSGASLCKTWTSKIYCFIDVLIDLAGRLLNI